MDNESRTRARRFLAVATAWNSTHGGVNTFNRRFCRGFAEAGVEVCCLVCHATEQDRKDAAASGVHLIEAPVVPGTPHLLALARKPLLPGGFTPDYIVGHGRFTGPAAQALAEDHFPTARRLHVVHTVPDEAEWHKTGRDDDPGERADERTTAELELGRTAHRVLAVGPRLHNRYLNELYAFACAAPLRFDPGFDPETPAPDAPQGPRRPPPGEPWKILLMGRAEDDTLKGLDIAAAALGVVARRRREGPEIELIVRGAPPNTSARLRRKLAAWSERASLNIVVRPFSPDTGRLGADLRRASLVLMPSRSEAFGLAGAEAIMAGTPVLVSGVSGLGALLREALPTADAVRHVIPVSGSVREDTDRWARAVEAVLGDRPAAFANAARIHAHLVRRYTWTSSAARVLATLASS